MPKRIIIDFPVDIEFPEGFERKMVELVDTICKEYEVKNPSRTMWPAGIGDMPIWNEPHKPTFDSNTFHIEVMEREK